MKLDLRSSLLAKIASLFLVVIFLVTAVLAFLGIAAYQSWGIGQEKSFFDSDTCLNMLHTANRMAYDAYLGDEYGLDRYYGTNYSYEIYAISETAKVQTGSGGFSEPKTADGAVETAADFSPSGVDYAGLLDADDPAIRGELLESRWRWTDGVVGGSAARIVEDAVVVGYVLDAPQHGDRFYSMYELHGLIYGISPSLGGLFAFSVLGFLITLVFLFCAAGHRAGYTEIVPNYQDRIPLDLYLAVVGLLGGIVLLLMVEAAENVWYSYQDEVFYIFGIAALGLLFVLLCLATLMTLVTRLKMGKWWRNSIIWIVCSGVVRGLRRVGRAIKMFFRILPYTWRVVLSAGGFVLLLLVLCTCMWNDYHMPGLWFLLLLCSVVAGLAGVAVLAWQINRLFKSGEALAEGNLDVAVETKGMLWDFKRHAENLNAIGEGMNRAVEQRMRSERLKTELITNVSHDIKTPLTSIVNYVDLLKKEELGQPADEYVDVLDRQSRRLKKLTEDLVEASKAATGNIAVDLRPTVVNELIHQAIGEYAERLSAGRLEVVVNTMQGNAVARADGRLLWRVLDNLLSNVSKYAQAGTRVYFDLRETEDQVLLTVKNISRDALQVDGEELTERFVRGDQSRNTEGSGLGLNIAKSLLELMKGALRITVDGDLFKAEIVLPRDNTTSGK